MATTNSSNKIETIYIFIFLFAFVISLIALTAYSLFRPEYTHPKYNFSPFPTVAPVEVPDANLPGSGKCQTTLQTCDNVLGCAMCGDCYECTPVSEKQEVVFNGQKVPPGNWCLPKGHRKLGCGTYTGRAVWADDPCSRTQGWKCVCLYPELFNGDDCLTQIGCRDTTIGEDQSNNKLVSSDGKIVWDPNDENFDPQGTTPYDYNTDGTPKFLCQCNQNKDVEGQIKYVQMPNDPYRCHVEPCTPDHILKAFDETTQQCKCTTLGTEQFAHSNVDGMCYNMGNICTWDDNENKCKCAGDQRSVSMECDSDIYSRPGKPPCKNPDQPGGSYCDITACTQLGGLPYCLNGSTSHPQPDNTCICTCNPPSNDKLQISGDRCEKVCIKKDVRISSMWDDIHQLPKPSFSYLCCGGDAGVVSYIGPDGEQYQWVCK